MEYPLIDTGMGDMPTAVPTMVPPTPKAPQPQDMQGVAFQLLAGMNPVLLGHAENVAKMANEKIRHGDILSHAARGIMPSERVQQIASVSSAPAPQIEDYDTPMIPSGGEGSFAPISPREQLMSQLQELLYGRNDLALKEADPTGMNQAFDNVAGIMGNAPMAPQMQRPRLSDTEQLGSLIAGALGGGFEGAAQAQSAAFQGAGVRANRENQIAQQNFEAENSQWINKLRTAQQIANNQANVFNQAENRNQRQFSNELRLQDGRIARTQQDIEDLDKQIQGFVDNTQKQVSEYTKLRGEMTDADMSHLLKIIDRQEKAQGLPKDYILERMMIAPVGWKSASQRNAEADDTRQNNRDIQIKQTQTWRNAKALFDMRLKTVNMSGQVTEADRQALLPIARQLLPESPESLLPMVGEDWRKIQGQERLTEQNRANSAREATANKNAGTSAAREDRLAGELGGGGTAVDTELPTVSRKEAGRKVTLAQGKIKSLRAKQKLEGDQKKKARYEIEIQGLAAERDYYQSLLKGESVPFNPGAPTPKPTPQPQPKPQGDVMSTMGFGIPIETSYADGGDKSQRTQAQVDNPTQNPPATTKPPEKAPNAGKGQVGKGKTKFGAYALNPKK
jgi:hypothetical protein